MDKPPMIGKNIQKFRNTQSLTLNVLSERSGVSKAMLSQIESDKVNPTVATVWKIAQGLGVELHDLIHIDDLPKRKFHIHRAEQVTRLDSEVEGVHIHVLSPLSMVEDLEMYMLTFESQKVLASEAHYKNSEEFLTVLQGHIRVTAGNNTTELKKGDFLAYHCDIEHSIQNLGATPAKVHMVVRYNEKPQIS